MIWIPLKSVGIIEFSVPLGKDAVDLYGLIRQPAEDIECVNRKAYGDVDGKIRVYIENNVVDAIGCYESCIYNGKNLIGSSIAEVAQRLGVPVPELDDQVWIGDTLQDFYAIPEYELLLWVLDGVIVSVSCGPEIVEEEAM